MSSCSYEGYLWMSSYSCAEKKVMSVCSYIGVLMHEQLLMCRKNTVMSSCSYKGTQAWAATNVQKKWRSWAATHVQKKMPLMSNCSKKGVLMHMSSCSCGGTRAWAAAHECKMNFIMHEQNLRGGNPRLRGGNTRLRGGFTRSWFLGIMGVKKT